jgi:GntR family transcriptional regulator, transcriptional repressor for pyruvate dehydrogenase complex
MSVRAINGVRLKTRVSHVRVGETVARNLRERILAGEFTDGLLPKQETLVNEFGVSAPSLREAFRVLEAEGLITVRRGNMGGAIVHVPDVSDTAYSLGLVLQSEGVTLADVSTALIGLEPMAVACCTAREDRHETIIPVLTALTDRLEQVIDDNELFADVAQEFHDAIVDLCGNSTIRVVINAVFALWKEQQKEWTTLHSEEEYIAPAKRRRTLVSHRKIIKLIADGVEGQAERAERVHLRELHSVLLGKPNVSVSVTSRGGRSRSS